jgi:O-antigen ligase
VVGIVLFDKFQRISEGIFQMLNGTNASLLARFDMWGDAMDLFSRSPVFGWGPAKTSHPTVVDGEYFLLLRRYGVVGALVITFAMLSMPFFGNRKPVRKEYGKDMEILHNTVIHYTIVVFFTMITNVVFSGYQILIPFLFFCVVDYKIRHIT